MHFIFIGIKTYLAKSILKFQLFMKVTEKESITQKVFEGTPILLNKLPF